MIPYLTPIFKNFVTKEKENDRLSGETLTMPLPMKSHSHLLLLLTPEALEFFDP